MVISVWGCITPGLLIPNQWEDQETNYANDHEGQQSLYATPHERITLSKVQTFRIHSATLFLFCGRT